MKDLWTGLALVLVIEGALYALFPEGMKRAAARALSVPPQTLRLAGLATACASWQRQPPHEVPALADASANYLAVLETLSDEKYTIIDQDAATRTVRVRTLPSAPICMQNLEMLSPLADSTMLTRSN